MDKMPIAEILSLFKEWKSAKSYLILVLISVFVFLSIAKVYDPEKISVAQLCIFIFLVFLATAFWVYKRSPPKNIKGKIGFLIYIKSEEDKEAKQLKDDFIKSWREGLAHSSLGDRFRIIELDSFYGKDVNSFNDLDAFVTSGKFHFGIFGETKLRNHLGSPHLFLEQRAVVKHALIEKAISDHLSNQLRAIYPSRVIFNEKPDYLIVESSSKAISNVCRYMLAVASYFTGDFLLSLTLLREIDDAVNRNPIGPGISTLKSYVKERIPACLFCLTQVHHMAWRSSRDNKELALAKNYCTELKEYPGFKHIALGQLAIHNFVLEKDIGEAKRLLKEAKDLNPTFPHPNLGLAFLYAYECKLDKAQARYNEALKGGVDSTTSVEIEEFIEWVLDQEPEKYQLYYCLGFINHELKKDFEIAKKDFLKYLEKATNANDSVFVAKAKKYLEQS